ncbi:MAG TPA: hypothetical protein VL326_18410 [Kofleriaceae bacterium]|nr:hypothetical protein [Kofleriaceae bacterium]
MTRIAISIIVAAALARVASADPEAEAKPHVEAAQRFYAAGKTAEALDELTIAYKLNPTPTLLYAIAQAHVVLDQCDDAIKFYEQFLATKPKQGPAKLAREAIDHCKATLAARATTSPASGTTQHDQPAHEQPQPDQASPDQPAPDQAAPDQAGSEQSSPEAPAHDQTQPPVDTDAGSRAWYKNPVAGVLVGGGVVAGAVGIVLYTQARNDLDAAQTAADYNAHHEGIEDARSKRTIAVVSGVGGVALIGAGIAYFVLARPSSGSSVAVTPAKGGAFVTWGGRF